MIRIFYLVLLLIISACNSFKEKVGLVKNQPDEYQVVSHPALSIPPDFTVYSPDEIEAKKAKTGQAFNSSLSKGENAILQNLNK